MDCADSKIAAVDGAEGYQHRSAVHTSNDDADDSLAS